MERRDFIVKSSAASLLACFPASLAGVERTLEAGTLERRALGRTGERLSIIGFGGIVVMNATAKEAADARRRGHRTRRELLRRGAELRQRRRDARPGARALPEERLPGVQDDRSGAARAPSGSWTALSRTMRNGSLRPLPVARRQRRATTSRRSSRPAEPSRPSSPRRKAGKVRFLGFSAHSVEAALALIGPLRRSTRSCSPSTSPPGTPGTSDRRCWPRPRAKQMGILALKAMARGPWPKGAKRDTYPKCWYEPLATPDAAMRGAAIHAVAPGDGGDPAGRRNAVHAGPGPGAALHAPCRGRGSRHQGEGADDDASVHVPELVGARG